MREIEQDVARLNSALESYAGQTSYADASSVGTQCYVDDEFIVLPTLDGQVAARRELELARDFINREGSAQ